MLGLLVLASVTDFVADNFEAVYWASGNYEYFEYKLGKVANQYYKPQFQKTAENG